MTLSKRSRIILGTGLGCALLTLVSLFLFDHEQLTKIYHASGFGFLFASFMCWLFLMCPRDLGKGRLAQFIRQEGWVLLLALALPGMMFLVSPLQFRILEDETNLLGVANSMFSKHSFANMTGTHYFSNAQSEVTAHWDIRPNFFPFLVYIAHCLKGYSAYNGFLVNYLAGAGSLWCLYWLLRRWFQRPVALLGMMGLAAFPVFVLWVTSSGFEVVNLCFSLIAFCLLYLYLQTRESYHFERLVLTLLLLAQCRYESSVFAMAFALVILVSLRWASIERFSARVVLIPLFFLPVAWQRLLKSDKNDYQVYGEDEIFSLGHWKEHVLSSWDYFTAAEERYGTIGPIFWIALLGVLVGLIQLLRKPSAVSAQTKYMLAACVLSLAGLVAVVFSYFWGDLTVSFTIRLGVIFLPFVILGFCLALQALYGLRINRMGAGTGTRTALVIGLALCLYHWPTAAKNEAVEQLSLNRQYQSTLAFLQASYPEHNNLIISDRPGLYSAHRWGSVSSLYANKRTDQLLMTLDKRMYQNILAIQVINYDDGQAIKGTKLNPRYELESVYETQFSPTAKVVISRVKRD